MTHFVLISALRLLIIVKPKLLASIVCLPAAAWRIPQSRAEMESPISSHLHIYMPFQIGLSVACNCMGPIAQGEILVSLPLDGASSGVNAI